MAAAESAPVLSTAPLSDVATLVLTRGNLPRPRDRTVGRDEERVALSSRILAGESALTLHGLGSTGKTRLALEAARAAGPHLVGGAWFGALEDTTDASAMAVATALALGAKPGSGDPVEEVAQLLAGLGRAGVVLDNVEQVVGPAARVVGRWTEAAPEVTLVCTSRVVLRVRGEVRVPVGPMSLDEATALLAERAGRPLTPAELTAAPDLVDALERLPLAIELAAARLRVLDVSEVRRRLEAACACSPAATATAPSASAASARASRGRGTC